MRVTMALPVQTLAFIIEKAREFDAQVDDDDPVVATTLPLLLSSFEAVAWLGLIILTGSAVTFLAYEEAFISVWCFFAAAASVVIALHFRRLAAVRAAG